MHVVVAVVICTRISCPRAKVPAFYVCKHDDDDQVVLDAKIEVGFKFFVEKYILHVQLVKATQRNQGKYPSIPFPIPQKKDLHPPSLLLSP